MEAILFTSFFTAAIGYPFYRITNRFIPTDLVDNHEPTNQEIRQSPEYRAWRITVLKQNDFKCVYYPATDNLEAHLYCSPLRQS